MRIVMFARVPRWYLFREDRLTKRLAAEGHEIAGVVVEQTTTLESLREWMHKLGLRVVGRKLAEKGLRFVGFKRRSHRRNGTTAHNQPAPWTESPMAINPPVHFVASHNSTACVEIVRRLQPEVVVLRGCGIVKREVLSLPSFGTINPHYALLPAYRGMDVTEWSALHGDPCAVSVHWVVEEVDAGMVIVSRQFKAERGDTLGQLREKSAALAIELLADALQKIASGAVKPTARKVLTGRQYFTMHPRLREYAELRLREQ